MSTSRAFSDTSGSSALAAGLALTLAAMACGDTEQPWGSTVTGDRGTQPAREAAPPPTPDVRELTAASPDDREDRGTGTRPLEPGDVTYPRAESLYREGEYGPARRHFSAYVEKEPDNPWGHYMLGLSAWKGGDLEGSLEALEAALERDPDHVKSLVNLSRVLLELDRPQDALPRVRRALEVAPDDPDVRRVAGNVQVDLGHPWQAVARYREALTLDGSDAWAANNFGLVLLREGRYRDAAGPLARAVELEPGQPVFRNNLGAALERTGRPVAAAEAYRAAAEAGHEKARVSLARVEEVGVPEEADPRSPEIETLARRFAEDVRSWGPEPATALGPPPGDSVTVEASPDGEPGPAGDHDHRP